LGSGLIFYNGVGEDEMNSCGELMGLLINTVALVNMGALGVYRRRHSELFG